MSNEKRRFTRVPFRVEAELEAAGASYKVSEVFNLSVGGCLLPFDPKFEKGMPCRLTISLSGASSEMCVRVHGEIVRCDSGEVAVKFTRIEPDSLFHLQNIVLYNCPDADAVERELQDHPGLT